MSMTTGSGNYFLIYGKIFAEICDMNLFLILIFLKMVKYKLLSKLAVFSGNEAKFCPYKMYFMLKQYYCKEPFYLLVN